MQTFLRLWTFSLHSKMLFKNAKLPFFHANTDKGFVASALIQSELYFMLINEQRVPGNPLKQALLAIWLVDLSNVTEKRVLAVS